MVTIFNSRDSKYKSPFGAVKAGEAVRFCITPDNTTKSAWLVVRPDEGNEQRIELKPNATCAAFCGVYTPPEPGLYWYWFEVSGDRGTQSLCNAGAGAGRLCDTPQQPFQLTVFDPDFVTPDWIKGGVIYQIFPDRFCREGDFPADAPKDRVFRDDWGGLPVYQPDENGKILNNDYFGGNLRGVMAKLPYLASLGVTAIYLNPIFEACSNHRYNTADYLKIDPLLGCREDLKQLCDLAQKYGIGMILDGVFNHTGDDSVYFNRNGRYPKPGAYQSQESDWYDWYFFNHWPDDYLSWWGFKTLPTVNKQSESFNDFIAGDGGVLESWLEEGVSGWRLDVADELPEPFLKRIRQKAKTVNPRTLVIGEVWEDASSKISYGSRRHYFEGCELDSVMNYPLRNAVLDFMKTGQAQPLNEAVMTLIENYPAQVVHALMNILGTHDTARLITAVAGEDSAGHDQQWKAAQDLTARQRDEGVRLVTVASAIQFFLPGVPCIYYGDETGMEGYEDPFNRRCYPWGDEDIRLIQWYRRLGAIRKVCPALAQGEYTCLAAETGFYAFLRSQGHDKLLCAVNLGDQPRALSLPLSYGQFLPVDRLGFTANGLDLNIPAGGCRIYGSGKWLSELD
jgi:cyclomaltodextrinase